MARLFPRLMVLVEADGAAGRPLKAPADHEPVIPSSSRLVLAVAGIDALGQPLDARCVHRPERVARLSGLGLGESVTPRSIASALWHPEGCGRGRSPGAHLVPVINKVDSAEWRDGGRRVARELVAMGAPTVLLTCCLGWPGLVEVIHR